MLTWVTSIDDSDVKTWPASMKHMPCGLCGLVVIEVNLFSFDFWDPTKFSGEKGALTKALNSKLWLRKIKAKRHGTDQ